MTTAADFVREILSALTDADRDSARLVFADWLEERGNWRSRVMRMPGRWIFNGHGGCYWIPREQGAYAAFIPDTSWIVYDESVVKASDDLVCG